MKDFNEHVFKGVWIGADTDIENRVVPIFKKHFKLNKPVKNAELYICGLGLFVAEINGNLPDDSVLNPAHSQYSKTVLYRVFDITEKLFHGENVITVELGNGFFNETVSTWKWDTAVWRASPELIADIVITYEDETTEYISTDENWSVTLDGHVYENSIYYGEYHDLRKKEYQWKNAVVAPAPLGKLKKQTAPPMRKIAQFKPKAIFEKSHGTYIIIAPEMITGWAQLSMELPEGTEITVNYGERLDENGYILKIGKGEGRDGNWYPRAYIQEDKFIGNGEKSVFEPKFSYKGFKYIQIENCPVKLTEENVNLFRVASDVKCISDFRCSDNLINELHSLMKRTLLNNFQGKPTDTPVWEKNGWLGDFSCGLASMIFNFHIERFTEEFVNTMNDCYEEYGDVPVMVPTAAWGIENSPVWNTVFVFSVRALMDYYGNLDYAEKIYPQLKKFADKDIAAIEETGGLWGHRGLADWVAPIGGAELEIDPNSSEGAEICANAYIYKMLCDMAYISEKLGISDDVKKYIKYAQRLRDAFNEKYLSVESGIYETTFWVQRGLRKKYRQTSNLLPLAFGMVPEDVKNKVLTALVEDIRANEYHLDTGCTGTKYILPVLFDNGYSDVAFKVLTQTTYPSWGYWIKNGATSAWECWEKTTRSENHYFLATYEESLFAYLAGIRNVEDGYKSFSVSPEFACDLEFVDLSLQLPQGLVEIHWKKQDSQVEITLTVPENSVADVELVFNDKRVSEKCSSGTHNWIL